MRVAVGALAICIAGAPAMAAEQGPSPGPPRRATAPAPPADTRRVEGRVVRPGPRGELPAPGALVTLHRIGPDSAGPIDSLRAGADGAYAFTYRAWGSDEAVYLVSAFYGGLAYFSEPLAEGTVTGDAAAVTVFDTTSAPVPITVRGRHLIVTAPAPSTGRRSVTEVYELSNDTSVTAVAGPGGSTFTALLPEAARDAQVGRGDVAEGAITFARGRAVVSAPFAPGLKQLAIVYTLPADAFPLSLPVVGGAEVLEVLVEDPASSATGGGLTAVNAATVSGRTFKRFLAQNVAPSAVVRIDLPPPPLVSRDRYLRIVGAVVVAAMAAALARALVVRRRREPLGRPASVAGEPDDLARAIADLDLRFERASAPSDADRASYATQRAALKAQLASRLAARDGARS